jgi:hypothetical protein
MVLTGTATLQQHLAFAVGEENGKGAVAKAEPMGVELSVTAERLIVRIDEQDAFIGIDHCHFSAA